ncbi:HECT-domain (ubiquitin-transferase) family protein [Babesia bovis T2Bo]|uniref:HECT-type E3 ubiquitin transferase n=1 Tax=Babesia bovis TaxID=5865 RepID=A7AV31_BABBO|nr:HECT-domain (ubiquitin-transferase) family protein [Babesia bovis T2Bo]EDO05657.1 HECT-domain (ubiquitin-transferase) family protein [Babesia bovis T2Bo]|eukprot:XP_001609225.1 ubiquitin transferase, HECT domain containing protein [Babesia bovis T2Bo]
MADLDGDESSMPSMDAVGSSGRSFNCGRWASTLDTLASGSPTAQLIALDELYNFLSFSTDENILGFPAWPYIKVLTHMIGSPHVKYSMANGDIREDVITNSIRHMYGSTPFQKLLNAICHSSNSDTPVSRSESDRDEVDSPDIGPSCSNEEAQPSAEPVSSDPVDDMVSSDITLNMSVTAATCLNSILDVMPRSANFFISHSTELMILQRGLEEIEYIDLAERILSIYDKLVKEIPVTVVKSGSLISMLRYLEFFALDVQIGTLGSVATAIRRVERGESVRNYIIPLFPYLSQALNSGCKKIVQLACGIWKTAISTSVRASYKSDSHSSEIMASLVYAVAESSAMLRMCELMFDEGTLSRDNINQCLYCLSIICNDSNEMLTRILGTNVLDNVQRLLQHSGESVLLRLVDFGLGMFGSYHTIDSLVSDCDRLYQRFEYFSERPDGLLRIIDAFTVSTLMRIFDGTISQYFRKRILLLVVRLLEFGGGIESCRNVLVPRIPLSSIVEAVCYTLRYNGRDQSTEVAVHVITCLLGLVDRESIGAMLTRYGLSEILVPFKRSTLKKEVECILESLPEPGPLLTINSGFDLVDHVKSHTSGITYHELVNGGVLGMDISSLFAKDSLPRLVRSIIYCRSPSGDYTSDIDLRGIKSLWCAFMSILESQPEFRFGMESEESCDSDSSYDFSITQRGLPTDELISSGQVTNLSDRGVDIPLSIDSDCITDSVVDDIFEQPVVPLPTQDPTPEENTADRMDAESVNNDTTMNPLEEASGDHAELSDNTSSKQPETSVLSLKPRWRRIGEPRPRITFDKISKLRQRGAFGFGNRFIHDDSLPFPFNHLQHELKLKLRGMDSDESNLPSFTIYIPPLVSVAKVEAYVLDYLSQGPTDSSTEGGLTHKRRVRAMDGSFNDGPTKGVQLYYKDVPLASTVSLYRALLMLGTDDGINIWHGSHQLQYSILGNIKCPLLHNLKSGRCSPLMSEICDDRNGPLALFLGVSTYIKGLDASTANSMLNSVFHRMEDMVPLDDQKMRSIFDDILSSASDGTASDHQRDSMATNPCVDNLCHTISQRLADIDALIGSTHTEDVLVTANFDSNKPYDFNECSLNQLRMLVVLHSLYTELNGISSLEVILPYSKRLTLKLLDILGTIDKSLCYQIPTWLIHMVMICPSLFSFESRRLLFDILGTGPHRFITQFHGRLCTIVQSGNDSCNDSDSYSTDALDEILRQKLSSLNRAKLESLQEVEPYLRVPKLKATCSRADIVRDAILIVDQFVRTTMESSALPRMEIEFENEVGVGTGPTQEFYSMVIESILRKECMGSNLLEELNGFVYPCAISPSVIDLDKFTFDMFRRASKGTSSYNSAGQSAIITASCQKDTFTIRVFRTFKLLGQLVALALIDHKLLDLRLNPLFWHLCQHPSMVNNCSLSVLSSVDPTLARSLGNLLVADDIDSAGLVFTYGNIPLVPGGESMKVTSSNLHEYVRAVIRMRLYDGIRLPIWAFRMGFATIVPLSCLSLFTPLELSSQMFSVVDQDCFWTVDHLEMYLIPDHGYDVSSSAYRYLLTVLSNFTSAERAGFLRFCTGVSVLPKQGFAGLRPIMRVVKKGDNVDELPSVMTCSNYLKLPDYKSCDHLREKLLQAISEGQGSFHLS